MKMILGSMLVLFALLSLSFADDEIPFMFEYDLLAKAAPDECFHGIGDLNNTFNPTGINVQACAIAGGQAKVNQAYVWGLTRAGDDLWFGTGPNINSLVAGLYMGITNAQQSLAYVAEYGQSAFARDGVVPPALGDWRPADIFVYRLPNGPLTRLDESLPAPATDLLNQTVGLRSAGASAPNATHPNGVVILAGPSLGDGIILFAFDAATRTLIEARRITAYVNIRKWLLHNDILYTTVTTPDGDGKVLRWLNDPGHADYPLAFQEVGDLDNGGAELAIFDGRLFVGTWPGLEGDGDLNPQELLEEPAGLYRSPVIPAGGLNDSHADGWEKVWDITAYDPDIICAIATGIGALHAFDGHLFWGTMHVPLISYYAHNLITGPPQSDEEQEELFERTWRSITVFRGDEFREKIVLFGITLQDYYKADLLYGETNRWARPLDINIFEDPPYSLGDWTNTATGYTPLFGESGFGNIGNNYTWTMRVYQDRLFVGTMNALGLTGQTPNPAYAGANLWCFDSANLPAHPVSQQGVGNYTSYGIRTMVSSPDGLYLGMANPMNLLTDTGDDIPEGGWELIRLRGRFTDDDWDNLPDSWETDTFGGIGNTTADGHSDDDTLSDFEEFIAGTDPLDNTDYPRLANHPGVLEWDGVSQRLYRVMQATNPAGPWQVVGVVTGANKTATFDWPAWPDEDEEPIRFFRTQAILAPDFWDNP